MAKDKSLKLTHFSLRRIWRLIRPYTPIVVIALIGIETLAALGNLPPWLMEQVVDRGIGGHNASLLILFIALSFLVMSSMSVISVWNSYLISWISLKVMGSLREQLYAHILYIPMKYFTQSRLGDLMSRFSNDVNGIQYALNSTVVSFITNVSVLVATILFMVTLSWQLTLLMICLVMTYAIPSVLVGRVRKRMSKQMQIKWGEFETRLEETLDIHAIQLIKLSGKQRSEIQRFATKNQELTSFSLRMSQQGRWSFMLIGLSASLSALVIYLVGGLKIIGTLPGPVTLGQIIAFTTLTGRLYGPAGSLSTTWVSMQQVAAQLDRVFEVLDEPAMEDTQLAFPDAEHLRGHIAIHNVNFTYDTKAVLTNISLDIQPGQMIACVGPSGAGKTTLAHLIAHMFEPTTGTITIDGCNINSIGFEALAQIIGVVSQETYLFHETVHDNIAYGRPDASEAEVIAVAQAAQIHEVIMNLPDGYQTVLGDRGHTFSGGERQRLAIARLLLKDPAIVILDEATSALDSLTETAIQIALEHLTKKRTTFVIAHRLSTVMMADKIIVLDKGLMRENGTHAELLAKNQLYARLYREQFRDNPAHMLALQPSAE